MILHVSEIRQYLSLYVWLISLCRISSRSIHIVLNGIISFFLFFKDWIIFHCVCVCVSVCLCVYSLSIHLSMTFRFFLYLGCCEDGNEYDSAHLLWDPKEIKSLSWGNTYTFLHSKVNSLSNPGRTFLSLSTLSFLDGNFSFLCNSTTWSVKWTERISHLSPGTW